MTFEGQRPQVCDEKKERTTPEWFPLTPESERDHRYVAPLIDVAEVEESMRVAAEAIDQLMKVEREREKQASASARPEQCLTFAIGGLPRREGTPRTSWYTQMGEGPVSELSGVGSRLGESAQLPLLVGDASTGEVVRKGEPEDG